METDAFLPKMLSGMVSDIHVHFLSNGTKPALLVHHYSPWHVSRGPSDACLDRTWPQQPRLPASPVVGGRHGAPGQLSLWASQSTGLRVRVLQAK